MPTAARLTISEEPPAETKGSVIPVTGRSVTTTPTLTRAWMQRSAVMPAARSAPNVSGAAKAMRTPRHASSRKAAMTMPAPAKPNSWPTMAKT
ncbi:MAG: hypothetical protein H6Q36_503 [Chloroflexi bacterium]|nr:hypothetical protein [Chloroflexota bacterium]